MKVLLDTHIFLWAISDPDRLSSRTQQIVKDARNDVLLSVVSAWEIAVKSSLGKLDLPRPAMAFVQRQLARHRIGLLPLSLSHLSALESLPWHHRDPFDRMLVAQCREEGASLITVDKQLHRYEVEILS
ncbi:MAG TPA: type II toxin-antitoxin system VapC family toxin [Candidatus Limnocylindrales bacterium]|nr:type II toxin-antitoxin system VapC family toxin [Candidatus Limnocylindrales bacterium]